MNENYMDDEVVKTVLGQIVREIVPCIEEEWEEVEAEFSFYEKLMYTVTSIGPEGLRSPVSIDENSLEPIIASLDELRRVTTDDGGEWSGVLIRVSREGDFSLEFEYADEE